MYCTKWIGRPCDETYVGKVGRLYVPIVPAQGKELYTAVCSLQAKSKRKTMVRIKAF